MSALWAPALDDDIEEGQRERTRLRSVPTPAPRLARFPFLLVLMAVFGLGMAGLLMLNTTLQNQAFQARTLNRQATELAYTQADLENQLAVSSAPRELARRASELGLRPNPYPALLVLPGGKVLGKATPVSGREVESLVVYTPAELAAQEAAAEAAKKAAAERRVAEEKANAEEAKRKAAEKEAKAKAAAEQKAADKKADAKKSKAEQTTEKKKTGEGEG